MEAAVGLLGLGLFTILLYVGCKEWLAAWQGNYVRRGLIDIPNTIHLGFLVFGTLVMCLSLAVTTVENIWNIFFPCNKDNFDK